MSGTVSYAQQGNQTTGLYEGNYATLWGDQRPKDFRGKISKLFPNGKMPLLALTSGLRSEKATDPSFTWWDEGIPNQRSVVDGVYTNVDLASQYSSGGVLGTPLFLKITEHEETVQPTLSQFRAGHVVLLRKAADHRLNVHAKVTGVASTSSTIGYIAVTLLESDRSTSPMLNQADVVMIIGNANPESGVRPQAISNRPTKYTNYTQIFRSPLSLSRTLMETKLRTGPAYIKAKKDAMEQHGMELERSLINGFPLETTGTNGKPERYTMGLDYFLRTYNPDAIFDYNTSAYAAKPFRDADGGGDWLDEGLELIFRYGRQQKLGMVGSGALLWINRLARVNSQFTVTSKTVAYGTQIVEWVTPFGVVYLKTHPLYSIEPSDRYKMMVFEPENIMWKFITNTTFKGDDTMMKSDSDGMDGKEEEYLTEAGFELHHPETGGIFLNIGGTTTPIV